MRSTSLAQTILAFPTIIFVFVHEPGVVLSYLRSPETPQILNVVRVRILHDVIRARVRHLQRVVMSCRVDHADMLKDVEVHSAPT